MKKRKVSDPVNLRPLTEEMLRHNAQALSELAGSPGFEILIEIVSRCAAQIVNNALRDRTRSRSYYEGAQDALTSYREDVLSLLERHQVEMERAVSQHVGEAAVPPRTPPVIAGRVRPPSVEDDGGDLSDPDIRVPDPE